MCDENATQGALNTSCEEHAESKILVENHIKDARNKDQIRCQSCTSNILNPGSGTYTKREFDLPKAVAKRSSQEEASSSQADYEPMTHFWQVADMYTFENIGFSNNVGEIKYLICADCERGPIGYYDITSKISYIALARVEHVQG